MSRTLTLIVLGAAASTAACTIPTYEAEPVSVYQWERRVQAVERQEAERVRRCHVARDDDPRKEELCRGVEREKD
jgi:hypothetical protein